jgi:nitrite reductase/ring-hydroxylating ferredoxin subunit
MAIKAPKPQKQQQQQQQPQAPAGGAAAAAMVSGSGWATVGKVSELFTLEKPAKPIITQSGVKLCVYKFGGKVYASDLESTAYRFPLFDGKLSQLADGRVVVEVPLDGTQYDLSTGAVVAWCPAEGGNPLRGVLGALKRNTPPVPLKVYPTQVAQDGTLMVKLI